MRRRYQLRDPREMADKARHQAMTTPHPERGAIDPTSGECSCGGTVRRGRCSWLCIRCGAYLHDEDA